MFFRMVNFAFAVMKFYIYLLVCRMETAICPVVGTVMSCVVVNQCCTSSHIYKEITYINEMLVYDFQCYIKCYSGDTSVLHYKILRYNKELRQILISSYKTFQWYTFIYFYFKKCYHSNKFQFSYYKCLLHCNR